MTHKENITAILECYFTGFKKEIIDSACNRILEQESSEDAISRREAIKKFTYNYKGERIADYDCDNFPVQIDVKTVKEILRDLPPVTPQQKMGHCEDCKHFRKLPYHTDTLGKCVQHTGFYPRGDWYCADYESLESEG